MELLWILEIFDLIKENHISIILSLDGDRETHNQMRGGFDDILNGCPFLTTNLLFQYHCKLARSKAYMKILNIYGI